MISRSTDVRAALRSRQRGFLLNPARFAASGPTDPDFASVSLLLHMNGSNGSTTFTDNGPLTLSPSSVNGNAQISTAQKKFGGASAAFDGSGDYIEYASNAGFDFGTGAFSVELWWRPSSVATNQQLAILGTPAIASGSEVGWTIDHQTSGSKIRGYFFSAGVPYILTSTTTLVVNTWYQIQFTRDSGGTLRLGINGTQEASVAAAAAVNAPASRTLRFGRYSSATTQYANGFIEEVRITKGVQRAIGAQSAQFPDS